MNCELCDGPGGLELWRDEHWRVVRVEDDAFPAFYRVVCNHHVAEFSDLPGEQRQRCMELVVSVERVLRERLSPAKVNLASLGNMTPHLHWHVIARFAWDSHFPRPVWAEALRAPDAGLSTQLRGALDGVDAAIVAALH